MVVEGVLGRSLFLLMNSVVVGESASIFLRNVGWRVSKSEGDRHGASRGACVPRSR